MASRGSTQISPAKRVVSNNLEVADAVIARGGWIKLSDYAGSATVGAQLVRKTSPNGAVNSALSVLSHGPNAANLASYNQAKAIVTEEVTKFYQGGPGGRA